ncbi:MAG TPA: hypothetical protein VJJ28_01505 [Candidatus Paceibacterota bacterium]
MDKKILQDIIPSDRRTIRNIVPDRFSRKIPIKTQVKIKEKTEGKGKIDRNSNSNPNRRSFSGIVVTFVVIFIGIALIATAVSLLYSKAVVTITPKIANFDVSASFTAKKDAVSPDLPYELMIYSDTLNKTILAADGPLLETKAKGMVILYNEQSIQQKIVAGTRLSNDSGLIHRTTTTVVIPAMKTVSGKNTFGNISVGVIADKSSNTYNMPIIDTPVVFRVVAYKGSDKYNTVYGKLKTAISGGFSGKKKIISSELQKVAIKDLEKSLEINLLRKVKTLVPEGYLFYKDSYDIDYEILEPVSKDKDTADISVRGTIYGVIFKKDSLVKSIAKKELDRFPSATYEIKGMDGLAFSITNKKDFKAKKGSLLMFNLKGPITIVGTFREDALKNELKGTYLKQSNTIFTHYPAIANAYAMITPFWMRSFPNSTEKIIIDIKN